MKSIFYNQLQSEENNLIFFCGDESSELLASLLSREMASHDQNILFLSNVPLKYPVEGQILVNIEPALLRQKLQTEGSPVFYLCSAIEHEKLLPLNSEKWSQILHLEDLNVRFMFLISNAEKFDLYSVMAEKQACMISSFNFSNLERTLEKFLSDFKAAEKFQEELTKHWLKTTQRFCPQEFFSQHSPNIKRFLFVNQVKSLIDENKIMGILRNLTDLYDKIFIGDINDFKIKEI